MLLDHYREQSIQTYSAQSTTLSQQWVLQFMGVEGVTAGEPVTATPDFDKCDIVFIKKFGLERVINHYHGERVEAYTDQINLVSGNIVTVRKASFAKWYRISLANGFYTYKNVTSGKVLELYGGESVQAFSADTHLASHQWKELEVAEGRLAHMRSPGFEGGPHGAAEPRTGQTADPPRR